MTLQDLLNKVCGDLSDTKTSAKLGVSRQMFSKYRNGRKTPSDEMIDIMAEIAQVEPVEAYLAVYAEKISNAKVAEQFRHLAA